MNDAYSIIIGENRFFHALIEAGFSAVLLLVLMLILKKLTHNKLNPGWRYAAWLAIILRLFIPINIHLPVENPIEIPWFDPAVEIYPAEGETLKGPSELYSWSTMDSFEGYRLSKIIVPLYFTVAAVYLISLFGGYFILSRKIKRWSKPHPESFDALFTECGIKKEPQVLICEAILSPMLTGFFRPKIVLPSEKLSREETEYIIRHELVHLKRRDLWYRLALNLLKAFQWFNPFAHIIANQAAQDIEISCDKAALSTLPECSADYSRLIVKFAAKQKHAALTTSWSGSVKSLKYRVDELLHDTSKSSFVLGALMCICAVLISGFFMSVDASGSFYPDLLTPFPVEQWDITSDDSWKYIDTEEKDPDKLSEIVFESYISRFVGEDVPEYFRIDDYRVVEASGRRAKGQIKKYILCNVRYSVSYFNKNGNTVHNSFFALDYFGHGIYPDLNIEFMLEPVKGGYKVINAGTTGWGFGGMNKPTGEDRFTKQVKRMYADGHLNESGSLDLPRATNMDIYNPHSFIIEDYPEIVFDSNYSSFAEDKLYRTYLVYHEPDSEYADEKLTLEITLSHPDNYVAEGYTYTYVDVEKGKFSPSQSQNDSLTNQTVPNGYASPEEYLEYFSYPRDGYAFTIVDYKNITEESDGVYAEVDVKGTLNGENLYNNEYVRTKLYDK